MANLAATRLIRKDGSVVTVDDFGGGVLLETGSLTGGSITTSASLGTGYSSILVELIDFQFDTAVRSIRVQPNSDSTASNYKYIATSGQASLGEPGTLALAGDTGQLSVIIHGYQFARAMFFTSHYIDASATGTLHHGVYLNGPMTAFKFLPNAAANFSGGTYKIYGL